MGTYRSRIRNSATELPPGVLLESHLAAHSNNHICGWFLASGPCVFDFSHDVHSVDDFAEDDVLFFEGFVSRRKRDEKGRDFGIWNSEFGI